MPRPFGEQRARIALMIRRRAALLLSQLELPAPGTWQFREQLASGRLTMGTGSYGMPKVMLFAGDTTCVIVGKYCSFAGGVTFIAGGNHRVDWVSTYPFRRRWNMPGAGADGHPATKGDIVVGNDVWIGRDATILSGVHVGNGAVIGAKALVTRDVQAYSMVAGVPARVIRDRFPGAIVERLERVAWWDRPEDELRSLVPLLCSDDVEAFLEEAERRAVTEAAL